MERDSTAVWSTRHPRMGDRRLAVLLLGVIAIIAVVADAILLMNGHDPPGGLLAVAGGCVGALATLVTATQVPPLEQQADERTSLSLLAAVRAADPEMLAELRCMFANADDQAAGKRDPR